MTRPRARSQASSERCEKTISSPCWRPPSGAPSRPCGRCESTGAKVRRCPTLGPCSTTGARDRWPRTRTQTVGDAVGALAAPRADHPRYDFAVQTMRRWARRRGRRLPRRPAHCSVGVAGDPFAGRRDRADRGPGARPHPDPLPRRRRLLRPQRAQGCLADAALIAVTTDARSGSSGCATTKWRARRRARRGPWTSKPGSTPTAMSIAWSGDFWIALNHIVAFKPLDFPLLAATETGLPRPGNWVGFLFQTPASATPCRTPRPDASRRAGVLPQRAPARAGPDRELVRQRIVHR